MKAGPRAARFVALLNTREDEKVMAFRPDMMTCSILLTGEGLQLTACFRTLDRDWAGRLAWSSASRLFNSMRSTGVRSISLLLLPPCCDMLNERPASHHE